MKLRVATFNLHHCLGGDGLLDVARTAEVVRNMAADVVGLQELDRGLPRSDHVDQPAELGRLVGVQVEYFPTLERAGGHYGIGLASRLSLTDVHYVPLPRLADEEPRGAIRADAGGFELLVTHLSTQGAARDAQIVFLAEVVAERRRPTVLLGDLNAGRRALGPLEDAGLRGVYGHHTLRRRLPRRQLDHILVTPDIAVLGAWTLATDASDHVPLVADLALAGLAMDRAPRL